MYERDIQQQEEGKGLNRGTPEHFAISDVSISMVTHYFDESFLRTEEDYVNTYSKYHLSDSIVEDTIFSEEFKINLGCIVKNIFRLCVKELKIQM